MTDDIGRQVADRMMTLCGDMIAEAEARGRKQAAHQLARRFESKAVVSQIGHPEDRTVSSVWNAAADMARGFAAEQDTGP